MLIKNSMNLLRLVKKMADCSVVVKSVNDVRNVLTHINLGIPLSGKKLRSSVNKVGGEDAIDETICMSIVEILKAVAEETKGCEYKDTLCTFVLKLLCDVNNRVTGGNHVVNDDNILTLYVTTKILMSNDRILTIDDTE